jgi:D-3-phosphoglycerate dehydrogenase
VARRALALGMDVLAFDAYVPAEAMEPAGIEPVARLHDLLSRSDIVTLHVLLSEETRALIDADALAAMRPGSFLVNCARGALVDHGALGEALRSGRLGGAALDVLPVEPPPADEPARSWPRTILNPHASWYSEEAAQKPYELAARDLMLALTGREPVHALARPVR